MSNFNYCLLVNLDVLKCKFKKKLQKRARRYLHNNHDILYGELLLGLATASMNAER